MKRRIGIGVVGTGAIGIRGALEHLSMADVQDRVWVAGVCDPCPERAKAAAEKYNIVHSYETYEELLDNAHVDAVTICSPINFHYEQGMAAIEKGKHIHFNKTMASTVEEADNLVSYAKKQNICIVPSPGQMLYPHNKRIRKYILEGTLGKITWSIVGYAIGSYHLEEEFRCGDDVLSNIDPSWYYKKPCGGPQYDATVYAITTLTGILGPAKRVTALSGLVLPKREYYHGSITCDMDDTTLMLVDFGNSLFGVIYGTITGSVNERFQPNIYGTDGSIIGTRYISKNEGRTESSRFPDDHLPHVTGKHGDMRESHVFADIMQLADWIIEGKPSIVNVEHARHVIDIIESGYRASNTGMTQELRTNFTPLEMGAL